MKFLEESKNELYVNLRSYAMKAEVKAEWNFEQSFMKSNEIGNRYSRLYFYSCSILETAMKTDTKFVFFCANSEKIRREIFPNHLSMFWFYQKIKLNNEQNKKTESNSIDNLLRYEQLKTKYILFYSSELGCIYEQFRPYKSVH